jgi:hypothetical protein
MQGLLHQVENGASAVQEIRAALESLEAHIECQKSSDQLQSLTENGAKQLRVLTAANNEEIAKLLEAIGELDGTWRSRTRGNEAPGALECDASASGVALFGEGRS